MIICPFSNRPKFIDLRFAVEIGILFTPPERFATGHEDDFVRIGILAHVVADVRPHIEIGTRGYQHGCRVDALRFHSSRKAESVDFIRVGSVIPLLFSDDGCHVISKRFATVFQIARTNLASHLFFQIHRETQRLLFGRIVYIFL